MDLKPVGLGTVAGLILGFVLAEILVDGNHRVYGGVVTICVVACTSVGGWLGRRK